MRAASAQLAAHLAQETTSLAYLWALTRADGEEFFFTDHDEPITYDGRIYQPESGFLSTAVTATNTGAADNLDAEGVLDDETITEADLLGGRFDNAEVRLFVINWKAPADGALLLLRGWLGEVRVEGGKFRAELRSISQKLSANVVEITSPSCRARLGDARCGVDLEAFTFADTVAASSGRRVILATAIAQAAGFFNYGRVRFTSGANENIEREVKLYTLPGAAGQFECFIPFPFAIAPGDTFEAIAGCDKSRATCRDKFDNVVRFRGEPDLPGPDRAMSYQVPPG